MVGDTRGSTFRLLLVVLIQLLNVEASATLVHVDLRVHRALYLNRLRSVPLLSVKLTAVHSVNVHHVTSSMDLASS